MWISTFITRWYQAIQAAGWIGSASEAAEKTRTLQQAAQRPDLLALARNPLLLTLMATLHSNRGRLPDDRADLYDEVVELLLQRWNETSGADQGLLHAVQVQSLKLGDLREVMQEIAFKAHAAHAGKTGVADISESHLVAALRPLLDNSADKAERALDYIENRTGLLLGQGERGPQRQYTFPHRTFQEYLAACHLALDPRFSEKAIDLARENPAHWREVLTLAARHAGTACGVPAADGLVHSESVDHWCQKGNTPSEPDWRAAILAAEQLLEICRAAVERREEHRAVRDRIAGWLVALLERSALPLAERVQTGSLLGRLGDPRPGVGVQTRTDGVRVPDLLWLPPIEPGSFVMGGSERWQGKRQFKCSLIQQPFQIAKHPITVAQYALFVEAKGPEWRIHLPAEAQWERAARHTDGRVYPWGNEGDPTDHCNFAMNVGHTSAVGLFRSGDAECEASDMAGNVWE